MTITAFMDIELQMWVHHVNLPHFSFNVEPILIEFKWDEIVQLSVKR